MLETPSSHHHQQQVTTTTSKNDINNTHSMNDDDNDIDDNKINHNRDTMDNQDSKKRPVSRYGRSVVDYVTEQELAQALGTVTTTTGVKNGDINSASPDWILPVPDPEAVPQTPQDEMQRLLTLQSYLVLDVDDKIDALEELTSEARQVFGVPTSLITLIDLGRQFLLAGLEPGEERETTRAEAFCSHAILNKKQFLCVPDTHDDDRFKNNPLVTDGPKLRFYAGAPLISLEGTFVR